MERTHRQQRSRARSLLPREHGTYGELAFPLIAALAMGRIHAASIALVVAFVAAFLAYEPLRLAFPRRGRQSNVELQRRAWRRLGILAGVGSVALVVGVGSMRASGRTYLLVPIGFAAFVAILLAARRERSVIGEVGVATALASCAVPLAIEGGVAGARAFGAFAVWSLGFALSTVAVRGVIAHGRDRGGDAVGRRAVALVALSSLSVAVVHELAKLEVSPLALAPLAVVSLALALFPPPPRHLRRVGWVLIAASASTAAILVGVR